jgi:hypothetical protein
MVRQGDKHVCVMWIDYNELFSLEELKDSLATYTSMQDVNTEV